MNYTKLNRYVKYCLKNMFSNVKIRVLLFLIKILDTLKI